MFEGRRLIIYAILLILMGVGSYFFAEPTAYDDKATYEISHAKHGNWEHARISGADLNAQNPGNQAMNQVISSVLVAGGLLLLFVQWRLARR